MNDKPLKPIDLEAARQAFANLPSRKELVRVLNSVPKINPEVFKAVKINLTAYKDALSVFPEIQKQLAKKMEPLAELHQQLQQIGLLTQSVVKQFVEAAKPAFAAIENFRLSPQQLEIFEKLAKTELRRRALDAVGLLPHASVPFEMLDTQDYDGLKANLHEHYANHWGDIRVRIRDRVDSLNIDQEAKDALAEALEAHGHGHYRSVCRLLLPEIERVARVELRNNALGVLHVDSVIGDEAGSLPNGYTDTPGYYALGLFRRLTEHIYIKVDASNRAKLEQDPVPNRHAAIHGLVVYNSFWNSLNVIFMTDYAFQVMSAVKDAQEHADEASTS